MAAAGAEIVANNCEKGVPGAACGPLDENLREAEALFAWHGLRTVFNR